MRRPGIRCRSFRSHICVSMARSHICVSMARSHICVSMALLLILCGCQGGPTIAEQRLLNRPSVVILLADDAGYADFGFTGLEPVQTPRIDQIAEQGVICQQGYVCASVCSPSRAGLLTGRYPQRFGHEMNLPAGSGQGLPLEETTLPQRLQELGYRTGLIGKWHLGEDPPYRPTRRGFDRFHGFLGGSRSYHDRPSLPRRTVWLDGETPAPLPAPYVTDAIEVEASRFIREHRASEDHRDQPFFLLVSFNAVHTPMHALADDLQRVPEGIPDKRRKYLAMMLALDRAVGGILDTLEDEQLTDNTVVMFLNDNGGATSNASDNGPLRGMKGSKFEGGIRVPWSVRWPSRIPAGSRLPHPISTLDIAPTLLAMAGSAITGSAIPGSAIPGSDGTETTLDGLDITSLLTGQRTSPPQRELYWRRAVAAAVRSGPWKLLRVESLSPQLFHLDSDPGEAVDRAADHPQVVTFLSSKLRQWEEGVTDPAWMTEKIWQQNQIEKHRPGFFGRNRERSRP